MRILKFISLLLFFTLLAIKPAFAQNPFTVTTSPNAFDLTTIPDKTLKETIKLRNNGNAPLALKIELKKLIPTNDGQITIRDFQKADDYQNWLKLEDNNPTANPLEWTFIPFTITVPKTAAFGYYYAIVISPKDTKATKGTTVQGAVAIPVLLSVTKDGMNFSGQLLSFTATNFTEYLPVNLTTTFENKGNVHVKPRGSIFITNWLGHQVAILDINKEQGSVLPNAKRAFVTTWDDSFITNDHNQFKIHFEKLLSLRFGQYTAHAILVVSGDKKDIPFEATTTFWVFPWKIILGIIVIIIFALIGITATTKVIARKITKFFNRHE